MVQVSFSAQDFIPQLKRHLEPFMAVKALTERTVEGGDRARRAFSGILQLAQDFSTFLDDHGARLNRTYAALAEYTACVRGFAKMGRHLAHLEVRLGHELPEPAGVHAQQFRDEVRRTLEFVKWSLANLQEEVFSEAGRLLGESLRFHPGPPMTRSRDDNLALPQDLDEDSVPEKERWIAEIASKFLAHKEILDRESRLTKWTDLESMRTFVLEVSDEQQVRFFTTRIHNTLSRYDTYIQGTSIESQDPDLPRFRTYVVASLHILEVMIELVHFYERHENDVRCELAKNRVSDLVDKEMVLDRILNYSLHWLHVYMSEMVPQAEALVQRYTLQTEVACMIPDGISLHARPVSLITRIVNHYGTPVRIKVGETTCYAGSILQVLMAVGANPKVREVVFDGDGTPLADLKLLFETGLGETDTPLPKELAYLAR
ncbi:MAG: hypothetical protein CMJ83_16575 [Planctomycetes bacterium]|nr:hypothetical protein [Planctomycetota bacterium]